MVVEFSTFPIGDGVSMSDRLARVMEIIQASKLNYTVGSMGTSVEGSWTEVMDLIRKCHEELLESSERVYTHIVIDDRKNAQGRLKGKVASLEKKVGRKLS